LNAVPKAIPKDSGLAAGAAAGCARGGIPVAGKGCSGARAIAKAGIGAGFEYAGGSACCSSEKPPPGIPGACCGCAEG
jgi:hypothetical protein